MISHPSRVGLLTLLTLLAMLSGCPDSGGPSGNSRASVDGPSGAKPPSEQARSHSDSEIAAADSMLIDKLELQRLQTAALSRNDAEAANRVGTHYLFLSNQTEMLAVYWYSLAIAQGHGRAMKNVAVRLYGLGGHENCAAALELLSHSSRSQLAPVDKADALGWISAIEGDATKCR